LKPDLAFTICESQNRLQSIADPFLDRFISPPSFSIHPRDGNRSLKQLRAFIESGQPCAKFISGRFRFHKSSVFMTDSFAILLKQQRKSHSL
jgi:hypothetical protein